ncbi:hypothetical protein ACVMB1_000159 [Bradyrhizobium sp. USDA 4504]
MKPVALGGGRLLRKGWKIPSHSAQRYLSDGCLQTTVIPYQFGKRLYRHGVNPNDVFIALRKSSQNPNGT